MTASQYVFRHLKNELLVTQSPIIALIGPRQSGKTTLAKHSFPNHSYVNLEDLELRNFASSDPKGFLKHYGQGGKNGLIIDEAQYVPNIFSALQVAVDDKPSPAHFILTGSQNFILNNHISQSLAGRVALFHLLPLSIQELKHAQLLPSQPHELLFYGAYPRIYTEKHSPEKWYPNYIQTYLEKDVRALKNIGDLSTFQRFICLCAGRIGQLLNIADLSRDASIAQQTAKSWLSLLEASSIIFFLKPHHKNFSKRLVKTPKLYFYDTGLASALLNIHSSEQVLTHYLQGGLFESLIISELIKMRYNRGLPLNLSFWRDKNGQEIDCIAESGSTLMPIEIKLSQTINTHFFSTLTRWSELTQQDSSKGIVIYGGDETQARSYGRIISWHNIDNTIF